MTRSVEIPEAAVEAALVEDQVSWEKMPEDLRAELRERMRAALSAALPYLAPAEQEDARTEEEKGFVETALNAVDAGNAGSWPTVAGYLADEVRRLRAAPAGDGGLREAVDDLRAWVAMQQEAAGVEESEYSAGEFLAYKRTLVHLNKILAAHPAAPAVPQPVDREALRGKLDQLWGWAKSGKRRDGEGGEYYLMAIENVDGFTDAVLAVLAGEQEQARG